MTVSWRRSALGAAGPGSGPPLDAVTAATPVRGPSQGLPPPLLGQHTEEVLRSVLCLDEAQLSELKARKII